MEWLAGLEEKDRRFLALGLTVEARAKWTDNALFSKAFDALKPISSTHWGGPEFTDEFRKVILEVAYRATPPTLPFSALKDIGDWAGKTGDDVRFEKPEDEFDFYGKGFALISDLLEEAIETGKASRAPRPANNKYDFHIADAVEENSACIITPKSNNKSVPPKPLNLDLLLIRVNQVASLRGKKSELADHLGVSRSRVSEWLNRAKEPGGKVTLRLLEWVQAEEASQQQNEKAGHASTRPAHKTRARKSKHEKSKASPK